MCAPRYRLALIITELDVGGAERNLVHLACGLDRKRFDIVVYALGPRPEQDLLTKQLEEAGVAVRFAGAGSVWQVWSTLRQLSRWLKRQRPDLVQTFLFHANVLGTVAAIRAGVRWRILGLRVADPARWRMRFERFISRFAQRVVCVSQEVADFAVDHGFQPRKLDVIPNGISLAQYPAAMPADLVQFGIRQGRKVILYVGRLHFQKGLDWLIELVPQMLDELPEFDLLLVGSGPQREQLEVRAEQLGVAQRLHFAGWRSDIAQILGASELLILPSRWEGMPNVLLEAMASCVPVVTTRSAGVQEVLGPLGELQTVEQGNAQDFVRKVVNICRDQGLARRLAEQNRERVAGEFSLRRAVTAYEALYESLLCTAAAERRTE